MADKRFDRVYVLKTKPGEIDKVKELCHDYQVEDNGVFEGAEDFHFAWGFGPEGMIYLSPTTFLYHKPDFNSVEEMGNFLRGFELNN